MLYTLIDVIDVAATIFTILIFVRIILSWISPAGQHPVLVLVYRLTEPLLGPVRSLIPSMGGMDFSPVLVLIGIQLAELVLTQMLLSLANSG